MVRVEVAPAVLKWARDRASVPVDALAKKFKNYEDWEQGRGGPTLNQLEALASTVNLPIGMFFLKQAPQEEKLPLPDFRRMGDADEQKPSTELIDTIHTAQLRSAWYRRYLIANGAEPLEFVGSVDIDDEPIFVAGQIRAKLGLEVGQRSEANNWTEFLRHFIQLSRGARILVMTSGVVGNNTHRPLDPREFRGFAIADVLAPLIFINGADTKAAQIFSLAHEIAHIWLGASGVSNAVLNVPRADSAIEIWCNAVAAELLVPISALRSMRLSPDPKIAKDEIARIFRVSTLVALRRLWEMQALTYDEFSALYEEELEDLLRRDKQKTPGGDFYNTMGARVDPRFAKAVIVSAFEGNTLIGDALSLLNVSNTEILRKEANRLGISL